MAVRGIRRIRGIVALGAPRPVGATHRGGSRQPPGLADVEGHGRGALIDGDTRVRRYLQELRWNAAYRRLAGGL